MEQRKQRFLYADCASGIAGDMFSAALIDIIEDRAEAEGALRRALSTLNIDGWKLSIYRDKRGGIGGTRFEVVHTDEQPHRHLSDIEIIIQAADLSDRVKEMSLEAFHMLAEAEAKVHCTSPDKIHFHEVGAVDSIIDIISAMLLIEYLRWPDIYFSPLNVGAGTVRCAHGLLPVPAPAAAELLKGMEIFSAGEPMERVTPTGAVLVKLLGGRTVKRPSGRLINYGTGLGSRESDIPNILRITELEYEEECPSEVIEMSANIDDMTAEDLGFAMERLFAQGALDVWFTPIQMKKNRPGVMISLLAYEKERDKFSKLLLDNTTTFGVRIKRVERTTLDRRTSLRSTPLGKCRFKEGCRSGQIIKESPEYEDLKTLAANAGISILDARRIVCGK